MAFEASDKPVTLDDVVRELSVVLEPSTGTSLTEVDPDAIRDIMARYSSNPSEWQKYAFSDYSTGYTRNLVSNDGGKGSLVFLSFFTWCRS